MFCPAGSASPTLVSKGYYSAGGTTMTASFQMICEEGFFCVDGVKYPCPSGSFGARTGLTGINNSVSLEDLPRNYFEG